MKVPSTFGWWLRQCAHAPPSWREPNTDFKELYTLPRTSQLSVVSHNFPSYLAIFPRASQLSLVPHNILSCLTNFPRTSQLSPVPHNFLSYLTIFPRASQHSLVPHKFPSYLTTFPRASQLSLVPHNFPSCLITFPRTSKLSLVPHNSPSCLTAFPKPGGNLLKYFSRRFEGTKQYFLGSGARVCFLHLMLVSRALFETVKPLETCVIRIYASF